MAIHNANVTFDPTTGLSAAGTRMYPTAAVAVSRNLIPADQDCVLDCTATLTLTVPAGLPNGFKCTVLTISGNTTTVAFTGTTGNGAGTSLARAGLTQLAFDIAQRSVANAFVVTGA